MSFVNIFEEYRAECWPLAFDVTLQFTSECRGGTPSDEHKAAGWLRSKLTDNDDAIPALVAKTMLERGITAEQAVEDAATLKLLNGFKRYNGALCLEGRHVKAMVKEAAVVALSANKIVNRGWGATKKSLRPFLAEHLHVNEIYLPLKVNGQTITEPSGIAQKFVHTFNGDSISLEEFVEQATIDFTLKCDWEFTRRDYAMILLTGGEQGLGSSRSQGWGRFVPTKFEQTAGPAIKEK